MPSTIIQLAIAMSMLQKLERNSQVFGKYKYKNTPAIEAFSNLNKGEAKDDVASTKTPHLKNITVKKYKRIVI